jgi:UDP-glucose 4-epimerase
VHNVAIIGSHGFIGSNLREHFDKRLINCISFSRETPFVSTETAQRVIDQKISDIIFLATDLTPLRAETDSELVEVEIENLGKILEFLANVVPSANFVFPSSGGTVYSQSGIGKLETDLSEGANAYGVFKAKCEQIVRASPLSHVILRISNVYGRNQKLGRGQGVIAEWINAARHSEKVVVNGSLNQSRDFIYVEDLNRAFEYSVRTKNINKVINIGSGCATSLSELIEMISEASGERLTIDQKVGRDFDIHHISLNIEKAQEFLGWKPAINISEGIKRIWEIV